MASFKPSTLVDKVQGRIGTVVYSSWKGKGYVRSMANSISNPQTTAQSKVRNALAICLALWADLENEVKAVWEEYAQGLKTQKFYQQVGSKGIIPRGGKIMTGSNAFVGVNSRLINLGLAPQNYPPVETIAGPETLEIKADSQYDYNVIATIGADLAISGSYVRFFAQGMWPGSHSYLQEAKLVSVVSPGSPTIVTIKVGEFVVGSRRRITPVRTSYLDTKKVAYQADVISPTGAKSTESNIAMWTISEA